MFFLDSSFSIEPPNNLFSIHVAMTSRRPMASRPHSHRFIIPQQRVEVALSKSTIAATVAHLFLAVMWCAASMLSPSTGALDKQAACVVEAVYSVAETRTTVPRPRLRTVTTREWHPQESTASVADNSVACAYLMLPLGSTPRRFFGSDVGGWGVLLAAAASYRYCVPDVRFVRVAANTPSVRNFREIQVYANITNVARSKPAIQSSVFLKLGETIEQNARLGVDGTFGMDAPAIDTAGTDAPWWRANLGSDQCVTSVVVYNRVDCCQARLAGAVVTLLKADMNTVLSSFVLSSEQAPQSRYLLARCDWALPTAPKTFHGGVSMVLASAERGGGGRNTIVDHVGVFVSEGSLMVYHLENATVKALCVSSSTGAAVSVVFRCPLDSTAVGFMRQNVVAVAMHPAPTRPSMFWLSSSTDLFELRSSGTLLRWPNVVFHNVVTPALVVNPDASQVLFTSARAVLVLNVTRPAPILVWLAEDDLPAPLLVPPSQWTNSTGRAFLGMFETCAGTDFVAGPRLRIKLPCNVALRALARTSLPPPHSADNATTTTNGDPDDADATFAFDRDSGAFAAAVAIFVAGNGLILRSRQGYVIRCQVQVDLPMTSITSLFLHPTYGLVVTDPTTGTILVVDVSAAIRPSTGAQEADAVQTLVVASLSLSNVWSTAVFPTGQVLATFSDGVINGQPISSNELWIGCCVPPYDEKAIAADAVPAAKLKTATIDRRVPVDPRPSRP